MKAFLTRHQSLLVAVVIFVTCLPYVARLGFHNDDWHFLRVYENAARKDLWSLMLADGERMRPVRVVYAASLYWLFQQSPLGYHLVNAFVLAVACGLFDALLRKTGVAQRNALALAAVWGTLPHAATGRFWFTSFQMFASIALLFGAALSELQFVDRRKWPWRVLALLCVTASVLMYEIAVPLFLLIPFLVLRHARRIGQSLDRRTKWWLLLYPAAVLLLVPMKILTTTRLDAGSHAAFGSWFLSNLRNVFAVHNEPSLWGFNLWRALRIAFVDLGVSLPRYALESARFLGSGLEAGVVVALSAALFMWLRATPSSGTARHGLTYLGVGFGLFLLGWGVFFGSSQLQLTVTGIGNRTAGAASLGVAFIFVGIIDCVASLAPRSQKGFVFAMLSATVVACGTLVIYRVAADWGTAWKREQQVLSQIIAQFPEGFSGKTLLLDGVCQYEGPATIFEASWDLGWALQTRYRDKSIRAEVVTPNLELRKGDLRTTLYGEERVYPYGSVIAFRPASAASAVLDRQEDAEQFFSRWDADFSGGCAPGRIGNGVDIFTREDVAYVWGFYEPVRNQGGAEWRWMGTLGVVRLRNARRDMTLAIKGRVPDQIQKPPTLRIMINGQVLDTLTGSLALDKEYMVPRSVQGNGDSSELRISSDQSFVPSEVDPRSADQRRLGLILYSLTWEPK